MSALGIIGALAGGYTEAAKQRREENLALGEHQRDLQIGLLDKLIADPSTPAEYKDTLLQQRIATTNANQYDKNGQLKLPSLDDTMRQLPPIQRQAPGSVQAPALQLPSAPPDIGFQTRPDTTGDNIGFVPHPSNAVPLGGSLAPSVASGGSPAALPPSGIQKPAGTPSVPPMLQMPTAPPTLPPVPVAIPATGAGAFHTLTPEEQIGRQTQLAVAHAQQLIANGVAPDQAFAAAGLTPKPTYNTLAPGAMLTQNGIPVVQNTAPPTSVAGKPQYEPKLGPGGEFLGVVDNTGQRPKLLTPEEAQKNPEAKKVADATMGSIEAREKRIEDKEARQLSRTLQVQTQAMINAMQQGAIKDVQAAAKDARVSYNKLNDQLMQDENRYKIMQQAYNDLQKNPANKGSFDAALAAFHMGMTVGQVKGMRTGKDMVMFHTHARSLPETLQVGFNKWVNGSELSDEQRANFLELAKEKMQLTRQQVAEARNAYDDAYSHYRDFVGSVGKGKVKMPEAPPAATSGPAVGTVEEGYRFKGGDAGDPNNWERVH